VFGTRKMSAVDFIMAIVSRNVQSQFILINPYPANVEKMVSS